MSPEEKKKQLKEKFKKRKETNRDKGLKSYSDLNIHIDKEAFKEWRNNR